MPAAVPYIIAAATVGSTINQINTSNAQMAALNNQQDLARQQLEAQKAQAAQAQANYEAQLKAQQDAYAQQLAAIEAMKPQLVSADKAYELAQNQINPLYDKQVNEANKALAQDLASRGLYGQAAGDSLIVGQQSNINADRIAQIAALANQLQSTSVDQANQYASTYAGAIANQNNLLSQNQQFMQQMAQQNRQNQLQGLSSLNDFALGRSQLANQNAANLTNGITNLGNMGIDYLYKFNPGLTGVNQANKALQFNIGTGTSWYQPGNQMALTGNFISPWK